MEQKRPTIIETFDSLWEGEEMSALGPTLFGLEWLQMPTLKCGGPV